MSLLTKVRKQTTDNANNKQRSICLTNICTLSHLLILLRCLLDNLESLEAARSDCRQQEALKTAYESAASTLNLLLRLEDMLAVLRAERRPSRRNNHGAYRRCLTHAII